MSLATLFWPIGYVCLLLVTARLLQWLGGAKSVVSQLLAGMSAAWLVVVYFGLRGGLPTWFGWTASHLAEPWERAVWPIVLGGWIWCGLSALPGCSAPLKGWIGQLLAAMVLLVALPSGADYGDMLAGNALWTVMALVAIGANVLAMLHFEASQAGRWALACFTVQLLTVAAVLLACYGSLGEFALAAACALGCLAGGRALGMADDRLLAIAWCSTTLACLLLGHVRIYSSTALPVWLAPLPMGLPALVAVVDFAIVKRRSTWLRIGISAALSIGIAALVVGWVFNTDGGYEEW